MTGNMRQIPIWLDTLKTLTEGQRKYINTSYSAEIHQHWPEEYDDINKAKIACVEGLGVRNYIFFTQFSTKLLLHSHQFNF